MNPAENVKHISIYIKSIFKSVYGLIQFSFLNEKYVISIKKKLNQVGILLRLGGYNTFHSRGGGGPKLDDGVESGPGT